MQSLKEHVLCPALTNVLQNTFVLQQRTTQIVKDIEDGYSYRKSMFVLIIDLQMSCRIIKIEDKKNMEMPGIEPGAFHMQSERSTTELHPRGSKLLATVNITIPNLSAEHTI